MFTVLFSIGHNFDRFGIKVQKIKNLKSFKSVIFSQGMENKCISVENRISSKVRGFQSFACLLVKFLKFSFGKTYKYKAAIFWHQYENGDN